MSGGGSLKPPLNGTPLLALAFQPLTRRVGSSGVSLAGIRGLKRSQDRQESSPEATARHQRRQVSKANLLLAHRHFLLLLQAIPAPLQGLLVPLLVGKLFQHLANVLQVTESRTQAVGPLLTQVLQVVGEEETQRLQVLLLTTCGGELLNRRPRCFSSVTSDLP